MSEFWRLLLLVTIAGSAVTFLGSAAIWFSDEDRRIRRALRHVLKGEPEVVILAKGRGRGVGFTFATNLAAVAWDSGTWCLVYRIDELMGAELSVDGQVIGRVFRGEPRRALDQVVSQAARVSLRLIFDDPRHPDFELDLWLKGDEQRREARSPADAIQEANRWLARAEAIVRRPLAPRPAPAPVVQTRPEPEPVRREPAAPPAVARPTATAPPFDEIDAGPAAGDPPWDDEPDADLDLDRPYKPVSKAARPPQGPQVELPFDDED